MRVTTFVVEGVGHFSIDMLRHDCAWPQQSVDAGMIENTPLVPQRYRVTLDCVATGGPCLLRWNSFGWRVIEINGRAVPQ